MGRKTNVLLTTLGCVGLASAMTAGSVFAFADVNAGNTTVAAELIPDAGPFTLPQVNIAYEPGGVITPTFDLSFSLGGGTFVPGTNLELCRGTGVADVLAVGTVPADPGNNTVVMDVVVDFGQGNSVRLQEAGTCAGVVPLTNIVRINAGAAAGTVATIEVDSPQAPGDTRYTASNNLATIKKQFTAEILKVTSKLDFNTQQNSFIPEGVAPPPLTTFDDSDAGIVITSDESIQNRVPVNPGAACQSTLNGGTDLNLELTGDLNGLLFIEYDGVAGAGITPAEIAAGEVAFTINGLDVNVCLPGDGQIPSFLRLHADNDPNTPMSAGVHVTKIETTGTGDWGAGNEQELVQGDSHEFVLDATTFFIPLIVFNPANADNTFTKLNSSSNIAGANGVNGRILTNDGTYALCTFPTITPGTALEISGQDWADCVADAGKTADLTVGRSAKIIVNAPQENVQGLSKQTFAGGIILDLPMQILNPNRGE